MKLSSFAVAAILALTVPAGDMDRHRTPYRAHTIAKNNTTCAAHPIRKLSVRKTGMRRA